ncbi:MAG TPA: ATP-binding protein [Gammaproteobacteria bacterium]|nr:ATP-binding protein [Gammaproteobacteria bacterium]
MNSLAARLGLGLAAVLLAVFLAQGYVVDAALRHLTGAYVAERLKHDAEGLLALLQFDPAGRPVVDEQRVGPIFRRPYSGHYYRVQTGQLVLRSRSLWDSDMAYPGAAPAPGQTRLSLGSGPAGQTLLMLAAAYEKAGHPVTVVVAEDYSPIEEDFNTFRWRYLGGALVALGGVLLLQAWVVRRSLRPLRRAQAELRELEYGEVHRLSAVGLPKEVAPLVEEINRLIGLIRQRLERSRNAVGNLAHALKTPLTVLQQVAASDTLAAHPELRAELLEHTASIDQYLQRELKRARLAGGVVPGQRFEPARELPPLVDTLQRIYRDKALDIELDLPPGLVLRGEREDLLELFGNLLDNACKWAQRRVRVSLSAAGEGEIMIEDDGAGVAAADVAALFQRGRRLDEGTRGHGLGLAIARDIVQHYGGEMRLGRSAVLGGFKVALRLGRPAA